jgi:predicted RNase H-like nuclease (RuvC/YqgF family)
MVAVEVNLEELKIKVQKLINSHLELTRENKNLKLYNHELKQKVEEQKNKISELEDKNKVIKLSQAINGNGSDQNARDMKLKINEYIREIDKCLALLHK